MSTYGKALAEMSKAREEYQAAQRRLELAILHSTARRIGPAMSALEDAARKYHATRIAVMKASQRPIHAFNE